MLSDQDIELLETYLDGALTDSEAATLKSRITSEVELQKSLTEMRKARELRLGLWQSFEAQANPACADRILVAVEQREARRAWVYRILDYRQQIATVAACIAVFLMGWQWGANASAYRMIRSGNQSVQPVGLITQQQVPAASGMIWEVRVNDSEGKLVRVERFANIADAQAFIEQVRQNMLPAQQK